MDFLKKPEGLSEHGERAYNKIIEVLKEYEATDTGDCIAFCNPIHWGYSHVIGAELVVIYHRGALRPFFSLDACVDLFRNHPAEMRYALYERMREALETVGLYPEEGASFYSGIYKRP